MSHSADNGDFIGTTTYSDNDRYHCHATAPTGRSRSFLTHKSAVAWLTTRYNSTH